MAKEVLKHMSAPAEKKPTIEAIVKAVAERYDLTPLQLKQASNTKKIAYPRQIAMYIAKELTNSSLPEIGKAIGGKHHTTVLHSIRKIEKEREQDGNLNKIIHKLIDSLQ
jgi:chromosomal replication initiator protein